MGKQAAAATASAAGVAGSAKTEREQATTTADEQNPQLKKLKKLLGQIQLLEEKQAAGDVLSEDQLRKIGRKEAAEKELEALEAGEVVVVPSEAPIDTSEAQVASALSTPKEILDHAIMLDRYNEKEFRLIIKNLRDLQKLWALEKCDKLQQQKLDKLQEGLPLDLVNFQRYVQQLTELKSSGSHGLEEARQDRREAQMEQQLAAESAAERQRQLTPLREIAIGVDAGGVLTITLNDKTGDPSWQYSKDLEVPGAMRMLRRLVQKFGQENVHIVSKCGGEMRRQTHVWLTQTMEVTKIIPAENIHFCRDRQGADGKGRWAEQLKLTHFIDDRPDCLWSVYYDEHGNAQSYIKRFNGKLFHFRQSGKQIQECNAYARGRCTFGEQCIYRHGNEVSACYPYWPIGLAKPDCVVPVDDWDHVERLLAEM